MTLAFWQAGDLPAAGRAVRDWARVEGDRPAPHRFAARIYEDMGAIALAEEAAVRVAERAPQDADAWERVGRLRLRLMDRAGAREALERARRLGPSVDGLLDLALVLHLRATSAARSPPASRRRCWTASRPRRGRATRTRSRAPTARRDAIAACEHALALDPANAEVARPARASARSGSARPARRLTRSNIRPQPSADGTSGLGRGGRCVS